MLKYYYYYQHYLCVLFLIPLVKAERLFRVLKLRPVEGGNFEGWKINSLKLSPFLYKWHNIGGTFLLKHQISKYGFALNYNNFNY